MKKFKDRVGTIWRSIGDNKLSCDPNQDSNTRYCPTREMVEFVYGPLTDVTEGLPTGEPMDTDDLEPLYQAANDREIAAMFPGDSPRKPEPGDLVRVSYEAEYHEHADDGHFVRPNDLDFPILTPSDVEITVIEPARPAVPEEPALDSVVMAGSWPFKHLYPTDTGWQRPGSDTLYSWESVYFFSENPPTLVERGEQIS